MNQPDVVAIARALLLALNQQAQANILVSGTQHPQNVVVQTFALDTAVTSGNPTKIGFPFQSVWCSSATDQNTQINLALGGRDLGSIQNLLPLTQNAGINLPNPIAEGYLTWTAQSGKTATLVFLTEGTFSSGKIVNLQSGGVNTLEGTIYTSRAVAGLSITSTASIIVPANTSRIKEYLMNQDAISVWLGDANVTDNTGANPGIELLPTQTWEIKNTAALYAVSQGTATKFARLLLT